MKFDVLVVGAGLAGAVLAAALRSSSLKVGIVETRPPSRPAGWDARIYAISPANMDFLAAIGIWQHLDASRMAPVYDMEIHGDAGGKLDFSAYDCGLRELAWIVESSLMQQELWGTSRGLSPRSGAIVQAALASVSPSPTSARAFHPARVRLDPRPCDVEFSRASSSPWS